MLNTLAYYGNGWKRFYDTSKQKDKKVFSTIFLSPIFFLVFRFQIWETARLAISRECFEPTVHGLFELKEAS